MSEEHAQEELNVDSLWLIPERDRSGKHANVYHGNFVPQIPNQLIRRYTQMGDTVADLFMGSGTTLIECERLGRNFVGLDLNPEILAYVNSIMDPQTSPILYDCHNCDAGDTAAVDRAFGKSLARFGKEYVDFLIAHPPYMDIVKFTDLPGDLSHLSDMQAFLKAFVQVMRNGLVFLKKGGYFAIVVGDLYRDKEVKPLAFYTMDAVRRSFDVKLKGLLIKNIEGNRGKLGKNSIWRSRALRSDYFIFKHEYILVFKKEF